MLDSNNMVTKVALVGMGRKINGELGRSHFLRRLNSLMVIVPISDSLRTMMIMNKDHVHLIDGLNVWSTWYDKAVFDQVR